MMTMHGEADIAKRVTTKQETCDETQLTVYEVNEIADSMREAAAFWKAAGDQDKADECANMANRYKELAEGTTTIPGVTII